MPVMQAHAWENAALVQSHDALSMVVRTAIDCVFKTSQTAQSQCVQ